MTQEEWNVCIEMIHSTQQYHVDCKLPDMNTGMMFVHILLFLEDSASTNHDRAGAMESLHIK